MGVKEGTGYSRNKEVVEEKMKFTKIIFFTEEAAYQKAIEYLEENAQDRERVFLGDPYLYYLNKKRTQAIEVEPIQGKGGLLSITDKVKGKIFSELKSIYGGE